jgi:hypothetical protein
LSQIGACLAGFGQEFYRGPDIRMRRRSLLACNSHPLGRREVDFSHVLVQVSY